MILDIASSGSKPSICSWLKMCRYVCGYNLGFDDSKVDFGNLLHLSPPIVVMISSILKLILTQNQSKLFKITLFIKSISAILPSSVTARKHKT